MFLTALDTQQTVDGTSHESSFNAFAGSERPAWALSSASLDRSLVMKSSRVPYTLQRVSSHARAFVERGLLHGTFLISRLNRSWTGHGSSGQHVIHLSGDLTVFMLQLAQRWFVNLFVQELKTKRQPSCWHGFQRETFNIFRPSASSIKKLAETEKNCLKSPDTAEKEGLNSRGLKLARGGWKSYMPCKGTDSLSIAFISLIKRTGLQMIECSQQWTLSDSVAAWDSKALKCAFFPRYPIFFYLPTG